MTTNRGSWRDIFVGRRKELDWLKDRWYQVLKGQPQLVVLLAESGLGKTRIAQEFYRWLSREHDPAEPGRPQGYWPDGFSNETESLDVNPSFDSASERNGDIPWLWWGLRWLDPVKRNQIDERCALSTFRNALAIHTRAIDAKKRSREIAQKAVLQVAETVAASAIPWVFMIKDLFELGKELRESRRLNESTSLAPGTHKLALELNLKDLALRDFRAILDPGDKNAPTVPVILLLDDAQWADSTSLAFVRDLFAEALRKNWKLLVILTHWEQEWNTSLEVVGSNDDSIMHARQLPIALGLTQQWQTDCLRLVHPLPEAEEIIGQAFPGLTIAQRRMVAEKSGGNIEMLREALLWFERQPRFFENSDRRMALSKSGEQQLADREFKLTQFIRERFEKLQIEVRRVLGWSSLQGNRFLAEITTAAADKLARPELEKLTGSFNASDAAEALVKAEDPHAWIGFEGDAGRRNLAIFRQQIFWQIASEEFNFATDEKCLIESAIREVLSTWMKNGKLDDLPSAERLDALLIAKRIFMPVDDEMTSRVFEWFRLMVRLVEEYQYLYLDQQAQMMASELFDYRPSGGWSFDTLSFWEQYNILLLLHERHDRSRRQVFAKELLQRIREYSHSILSYGTNRKVMAAVFLTGDIELVEGDFKTARAHFEEGLVIARQEVAENGANLEALQDLSVLLNRVADSYLTDGHLKTAREHSEESLATCRKIIAEFGSGAESLRFLSFALYRIGDIDLAEGDLNSARTHSEESLAICRQTLADYGSGSDGLRALSARLRQIGDIEFTEGNLGTARSHFEESLKLSRQILVEYGTGPTAMRELSISLDRVGDINRATWNFKAARLQYEESLAICRQILAEYGASFRSLRDLSLSLERLADVEQTEGDIKIARKHSLECLAIRRQILANYGLSCDALSNFSSTLRQVGDIERAEGDLKTAGKYYEECLAINRQILSNYSLSHKSLLNVSLSLERIGDIYQAEGNIKNARKHFEECLVIRRYIVAEYGSIRGDLDNLSIVLNRIGSIEQAEGDIKTARKHYEECLAIHRRLLANYDPCHKSLLDLKLSLERMGNICRAEGDLKTARKHFEECLVISRHIVAEYDSSFQTLLELSILLARIANIERTEGEFETARTHYEESLAIRRQILDNYGPSVDALWGLSVSLRDIGDFDRQKGDLKTATKSYEESLAICRLIIDDYGVSPHVLQNLVLLEVKCAEVAYLELNLEKSSAHIILAKSYLSELRFRGWAAPQTDTDENILVDLSMKICQVDGRHPHTS
jgi:tetratricopeptide (TPR) repeat protein